MLLAAVLVILMTSPGGDTIHTIASPPDLLACYREPRENYTRSEPPVVAESLCIMRYLWSSRTADSSRQGMTPTQNNWIESLYRDFFRRLQNNAMGSIPVRKEYRMLTDNERERYHSAVNRLKADTSVSPNKYDAVAAIHAPPVTAGAHNGAGFLCFHRIYMLVYETALMQVDPGVTLPYWDGSLDAELPDPTSSAIWSQTFAGSGTGFVTTGPFANWNTPYGPLTRNIGQGSLINKMDVDQIMSANTGRRAMSLIERSHGKTHIWVGGQMGSLSQTSYDPLFFMYHAYIDCLWEQHRQKQQRAGVDPTTDYSVTMPQGDPHHPDSSTGMWSVSNLEALQHQFGSMAYECAPSPTCSPSYPYCAGSYMQCDTNKYLCVPMKESDVEEHPNPCSNQQEAQQNQYCIDGVCDSDGWVYVPVHLVQDRPPEKMTYKSYSIENNQATTDCAYDPDYTDPNTSKPPPVVSCPAFIGPCSSADSVITYESHGVNYDGAFREKTKLDKRFEISSSMAYVGVKHPGNSGSEAIIRVYDSCGRMCRPSCLKSGSNPPVYETCTGVINVQSDNAQSYGETHDKAVNLVWQVDSNPNKPPTYNPTATYLQFHCDHSEKWPLYTEGHVEEPVIEWTTPYSGGTNAPSGHNCVVGSECDLGSSCPCPQGAYAACKNRCDAFGHCDHGKWFVKTCGYGLKYNPLYQICDWPWRVYC